MVLLIPQGAEGGIEGRALNPAGVGVGSGKTCPRAPIRETKSGLCGWSPVRIKEGGVASTPEGLAHPAKDVSGGFSARESHESLC